MHPRTSQVVGLQVCTAPFKTPSFCLLMIQIRGAFLSYFSVNFVEGKTVRQDQRMRLVARQQRLPSRWAQNALHNGDLCPVYTVYAVYRSHMLRMLQMTHQHHCTGILHFSLTSKKLSRQTVKLFAEIQMWCLALLRVCTKCPLLPHQSVRSEPEAFWLVFVLVMVSIPAQTS